jgi:hypothetical protein
LATLLGAQFPNTPCAQIAAVIRWTAELAGAALASAKA